MSEINGVKRDQLVSEIAENPTVGRSCIVDVCRWSEPICMSNPRKGNTTSSEGLALENGSRDSKCQVT
jgi:hypothetical protein